MMKIPQSIRISFEGAGGSVEAGSSLRGTVHLNAASPGCCRRDIKQLSSLPPPTMIPFMGETKARSEEATGMLDSNKEDVTEIVVATLKLSFLGVEKTIINLPQFTHRGRNYTHTYSDDYIFAHVENAIPVTIADINETQTIDFSLNIPADLPTTIPERTILSVNPRKGFAVGSIDYELRACLQFKNESVHDDSTSCLANLVCDAPVKVRKRSPERTDTKLSVWVKNSMDIPSFICGCIPYSTHTTFSLEAAAAESRLYLRLCCKQPLQICIDDPHMCQQLGIVGGGGSGGSSSNHLMVKLTQKIKFHARPTRYKNGMDSDLHFDRWSMRVHPDSKGVVIIPSSACNLYPSYQGEIVQYSHELIGYVHDPKSNTIIATTQPIPVDLHEQKRDLPDQETSTRGRYISMPNPNYIRKVFPGLLRHGRSTMWQWQPMKGPTSSDWHS